MMDGSNKRRNAQVSDLRDRYCSSLPPCRHHHGLKLKHDYVRESLMSEDPLEWRFTGRMSKYGGKGAFLSEAPDSDEGKLKALSPRESLPADRYL